MAKLIFNRVIRVLILSDLALVTGIGFVNPIFAIFLTENIKGGTIEVVGFAAAIYWLTECIVVIPFAKFLDKRNSEKADLSFIIIGNILSAAAVFGYMFASVPWHIYALEALYAVGLGMNSPAYMAIFTRHIDQGREAFSWSARSSLVAAGSGAAGALGGIIVSNYGFNALFTGVIAVILLSSVLPFLIKKDMKLKNGAIAEIPGAKANQPNLSK